MRKRILGISFSGVLALLLLSAIPVAATVERLPEPAVADQDVRY